MRAHTKIAGSVLKESEQEFISLLATDRRLFRLRSILTPDQPLIFLNGDQDALEELPYASISAVVVRTERRKSQIVAGLVIAAFAVLGHSWLQITGTALFLLGMAGVLHALLVPTRWAEVLQQPPMASAIHFKQLKCYETSSVVSQSELVISTEGRDLNNLYLL